MTSRVLAVLFTLSVPFQVSAQPIYGTPQKAAYASPAEWPTFSGQCHWLGSPTTNATPGIPAHVHVDLTFPLYGVTTVGTFTVPFSITLFNVAGKVTAIGGIRFKSYTLDNGVRLPLIGNPNGVRTWTGLVTFEPTNAPPRGFMRYSLDTITNFTNGDDVITSLAVPRYSLLDPAAVETGSGNTIHAWCRVGDATDPVKGRWGQSFTEFHQFLPVLGPISPELPWRLLANTHSYALVGPLPKGTSELHLDPDLHNGNPGTLLYRVNDPVNGSLYSVPGSIPDGTHKLLFMWRRPNFAGDREVTSNLVFTVNVGPGGVAQPPERVLGNLPPAPPPPPPPSPCTAGASSDVSVSGKTYRVTVTGACVPSVVGPL